MPVRPVYLWLQLNSSMSYYIHCNSYLTSDIVIHIADYYFLFSLTEYLRSILEILYFFLLVLINNYSVLFISLTNSRNYKLIIVNYSLKNTYNYVNNILILCRQNCLFNVVNKLISYIFFYVRLMFNYIFLLRFTAGKHGLVNCKQVQDVGNLNCFTIYVYIELRHAIPGP